MPPGEESSGGDVSPDEARSARRCVAARERGQPASRRARETSQKDARIARHERAIDVRRPHHPAGGNDVARGRGGDGVRLGKRSLPVARADARTDIADRVPALNEDEPFVAFVRAAQRQSSTTRSRSGARNGSRSPQRDQDAARAPEGRGDRRLRARWRRRAGVGSRAAVRPRCRVRPTHAAPTTRRLPVHLTDSAAVEADASADLTLRNPALDPRRPDLHAEIGGRPVRCGRSVECDTSAPSLCRFDGDSSGDDLPSA